MPLVVARRRAAITVETHADGVAFQDHHRGHDPPGVRPESPAPTRRHRGERRGGDGVGWRGSDARFGSHVVRVAQRRGHSQDGDTSAPASTGLTARKDVSTLRGSRGGTEEPAMTWWGRTGAAPFRCDCACLLCFLADARRTLPPTPPPSSGPANRSAGPGGGPSELRSDRLAVRDRRAVGGHVLSGGVGSLAAPPVGETGTKRHRANSLIPPNPLIFHAPRVIRTPDLLIRRRTVGGAVRDFSGTSALGCSGRAHEKSSISPQTGTRKAQCHYPRKFCLARRGWRGCGLGPTTIHRAAATRTWRVTRGCTPSSRCAHAE